MASKDVASSSADGSSAKAKVESKAYPPSKPSSRPPTPTNPLETPVDIPRGFKGVTTPVPKSPVDVTQEPAGDVASPTPLSGQAAAEPPQTETTGGRVLTRDGQPYAVFEQDGSVTIGVHTQQPFGETHH